ncbi:hypothetical protein SISSUDRAFT_967261, partial [Sistotremastrum suecicum HHB10207 ss-3]
FERVTITDVDGRASINDLRAAALKHMKVKGGAFIKVSKPSFARVAREIASVSLSSIERVARKFSSQQVVRCDDEEERTVLRLMRQIKLVVANVPGSSTARMTMRNETRALILTHGFPTFYVTINPADVYNPIVRMI